MPIKKIHKTHEEEPQEETYIQGSLFEDEEDGDTGHETPAHLHGGMAALEKALAQRSQSGDDYFFKFDEEGKIVLFLSDGPLHIYMIHWVDMPQEDGKKAPRSFTCTVTDEGGCPLCDVGLKARFTSDWPVLQLVSEGDELVEGKRIMSLGPGASRELVDINRDKRKGPIKSNWYLAKRTGKGFDTRYTFDYLKYHDLEEDYGVPTESAKELEKEHVDGDFDWYKPPVVNREALAEAASVVKKAL